MENWKRNLYVCWFGVFAASAGLSQVTPILPLYIDLLGVHNVDDIERWSGIAFGVTFIIMAVVSPLWGHAADKYGRKPMLLRASLGMAVVITCMGFAQNVYQLVGLRLVMGAISGFISASITLVATQTPKERSGWALGTLSTGSVGGMLLGPLIGGYLADTVGLRSVFLATGSLLFVAFLASLLFIREEFTPSESKLPSMREVWQRLPNPQILTAMFVTTFILQTGLMSIQPIITVYITKLSQDTGHVALISGLVFASSGFASMFAAPRLGKLSDAIGHHKVILMALLVSGLLYLPQAFVDNAWELMGLRFLLGLATAGLLPAINSMVKQASPEEVAGRVFGFNQSAQFLGSFSGAIFGGQLAALFGIEYVFFCTGALLLLNACWVYRKIYRSLN